MQPDPILAAAPDQPLRNRGPRRWLAALAAVAFLGVAAITLLTYSWFIYPISVTPPRVDVVVVLAGGWGERLNRGLELIRSGRSNAIILNTAFHWNGPEAQPVKDLCATKSQQFEVICVAALPDNTKGEAMVMSRIAAERHWTSLAVVTTNHHLSRSERWFRRCFAGAVYPVSAGGTTIPMEIVHEWLGVLAQFTLDRDCR